MKKLNSTHQAIAQLYAGGRTLTSEIASQYGLSSRQVQRIAKKYGVLRTQSESNKLMVPLKNYAALRVPMHLKAKRKQISQRLRYQLISAAEACAICFAPKGTVPFHVDHKDDDATNNELTNLQVICAPCNIGKSHLARYGEVT